ncbi:hypothetical protein ACIRFH_18610 [Streptomyces sp. NPDC093586]
MVGTERIRFAEDLGGADGVQEFDPVVDEGRHPMRAGVRRPILE